MEEILVDIFCVFYPFISHQMLQQRAHRRASSTLKMVDVSPKLANLNSTKIAMPGVVSASQQVRPRLQIYLVL